MAASKKRTKLDKHEFFAFRIWYTVVPLRLEFFFHFRTHALLYRTVRFLIDEVNGVM